jgi:hypothetical protein
MDVDQQRAAGLIVSTDRLISGAYHAVELLFEVQSLGDYPGRSDQRRYGIMV